MAAERNIAQTLGEQLLEIIVLRARVETLVAQNQALQVELKKRELADGNLPQVNDSRIEPHVAGSVAQE
jgi:regulator of replication initiation timing